MILNVLSQMTDNKNRQKVDFHHAPHFGFALPTFLIVIFFLVLLGIGLSKINILIGVLSFFAGLYWFLSSLALKTSIQEDGIHVKYLFKNSYWDFEEVDYYMLIIFHAELHFHFKMKSGKKVGFRPDNDKELIAINEFLQSINLRQKRNESTDGIIDKMK